jgi:hypothetical protein
LLTTSYYNLQNLPPIPTENEQTAEFKPKHGLGEKAYGET